MLAIPKVNPMTTECAGLRRQPAARMGRYAMVTEIGGIWRYPRKVNDINSSTAISIPKA